MGKRIDAETKDKIVEMYLADETLTYRDLASKFGINHMSVSRIINGYFKDTNGIKPDRHKPKKHSFCEKTERALDTTHDEVMRQKYPPSPRTSDWTDHITPLHRHKQELENAIAHKQAELDKARQEYREFLATLEQLMKEEV